MVFDVSNRVFLNLLLLALFGREKEVCDRLQRHPLIYPMFSTSPQPSPERRGKRRAISISLARQNLHLVIYDVIARSRTTKQSRY
jgi:hypothetical protein